jgi:hypothetical protein
MRLGLKYPCGSGPNFREMHDLLSEMRIFKRWMLTWTTFKNS